ncbi:universal stress protein [Actinomadura barringtoniae]|uniref:Universal stress protein n=1 Tax=Actinomadura barringtoniae TaxID=1427535 RepID=A0A939P8S8_9ACTN|nr:universal stress protein [Actinomadura barringtoniae]
MLEPWHETASLFTPPEATAAITKAVSGCSARAEEMARECRADIVVSAGLVTDRIGPALRERSERAFAMVLGHRGRGGFASMLLGSVGLGAAHAAGPVVIVRGEERASRSEAVVGIDLVKNADEALRYAFDAASIRGARLRVVHAWQMVESLTRGYLPRTLWLPGR